MTQTALQDALALHQQGRLAEAEKAYAALVQVPEAHADAHHMLGVLCYQQGRFGDAENHISAALAADENNAGAHTALAELLRRKGRNVLAGRHAQTALDLDDTQADAHHVLALLTLTDGDADKALSHFNLAISLNDEEPAYYTNRAEAFRRRDRLSAAMADYHRALRLIPEYPEALTGLALVEEQRGNVPEALVWHDRAETALPSPTFGSNALMARAYDAKTDAPRLKALHHDWASRYLGTITEHHQWPKVARKSATSAPRIRVGYFAAYWRRHPVGSLTLGALTAHNPDKVELYFYAAGTGDDTENHLRRLGPLVSVAGMTDEAAARRIRDDHLDILVDTAGHTRGNRLGIFAHRAAPVQMHWRSAYWHASGLPTMDYLLTDANETPTLEDGDLAGAEQPVRLTTPGTVFDPHPDAPAVSELPMLTSQRASFGCFNRLAKIGDEVLQVWASILNKVPDARMVLQSPALDDPDTRELITKRYARAGGDADQLEMIGRLSEADVYAAYNNIDVALDPFPFSGSIITCEALWMGVPVITLPGTIPAGRHSRGFLKALGMETFIASDARQYARIAERLVSDPDTLAKLRTALRPRMKKSAICDGARLARALESAFELAMSEAEAKQKSGLGRLLSLFRRD